MPPTADRAKEGRTCSLNLCLRGALYEAAKNSSHGRSPDHGYDAKVKGRHDGKIAAISVARQFARRSYHVLRAVDPDAVYAIPA